MVWGGGGRGEGGEVLSRHSPPMCHSMSPLSYSVSKLLLLQYSRTCAMTSGLLVLCCCPGWTRTDMNYGEGPKTIAEGADTPAWLCTEAASELVGAERGGFYQDRSLEALGGGWKAAIEGSLDEYMAAKHAAAAEKPKSG